MPTKKRNQVLKGKHGGMQLVLTEDVTHLGKQGEVVEVKPGYGRNYLLPNGLATIPTAHNLKLLELYKQRVRQARESKIADLRVLSEQIQRVPHITIDAHANEEGHLYGSGDTPMTHSHKSKPGVDVTWSVCNVGGTSGLFACFLGLMLGYNEIVLGGVNFAHKEM